jgi:thioredoxin 1
MEAICNFLGHPCTDGTAPAYHPPNRQRHAATDDRAANEWSEDMAKVMQFDASNFQQEVVKSDVPVLVDFWAPWCGPCKMIGPVIEELAGDYAGKAKVGKVNVDDNQQLAGQFGIRGIPTVMLFKNGEAIESFVGLQQKGDLAAALDKAL